MHDQRDKQSPPVFIEYRDQMTPTGPLEDRSYTMTHSDATGDLFVTIGKKFAFDKTNALQDQVFLKWVPIEDKLFLYGEVMIDAPNMIGSPKQRNEIFQREMPLALSAIYMADSPFFKAHPELQNTPVLINFQSTDPEYDKLYHYGIISDYVSFL